MSRKVRILEVAADEAAEAAAWYEIQRPGLGMELDRAVDAGSIFSKKTLFLSPLLQALLASAARNDLF